MNGGEGRFRGWGLAWGGVGGVPLTHSTAVQVRPYPPPGSLQMGRFVFSL